MIKTPYESFKTGILPIGCRMCLKGEKSVLFVTGKCSKNCYYCSLSDNKKNKDKIIINEWETENEKDILEEIRLCGSKGVGITGGDPLIVLDRTVKLIKLLKKEFGEKFHIHLYTPLTIVSKDKLKKLYEAGLDEIRFHPNVDDNKNWEKINIAKEFKWKIGVEIPALPNKLSESLLLIEFLSSKIDFLNINELEISDNNFQDFEGLGFSTIKDSYAIKNSISIAKKIGEHAYKKGIKNVHVCSATTKDKYQLRKRILRRAKNSKKEYDVMTQEGMLIRGAVYTEKDDFNIKELKKIKKYLVDEFDVPQNLINIDLKRNRVLTRVDVVNELKDELKSKNWKPAIVEEYPTIDCFPIEINYI